MYTSSNMTYSYQATVQAGSTPGTGIWLVTLDAMVGGTAVTVSAQSQAVSFVLTDVIFGDVWICSGQSNMQFTTVQVAV